MHAGMHSFAWMANSSPVALAHYFFLWFQIKILLHCVTSTFFPLYNLSQEMWNAMMYELVLYKSRNAGDANVRFDDNNPRDHGVYSWLQLQRKHCKFVVKFLHAQSFSLSEHPVEGKEISHH